jgi:hypothetical protein
MILDASFVTAERDGYEKKPGGTTQPGAEYDSPLVETTSGPPTSH